ncbi:hypothetical protein WJX77_002939 [Trebouxia sp. C0004]
MYLLIPSQILMDSQQQRRVWQVAQGHLGQEFDPRVRPRDASPTPGVLMLLGVEDAVYKIAHQKLVENEIMIHQTVHATVPYIVKSDLDMLGFVEGAGAGSTFLKLQHLGRSLEAVPLKMLSHYWSCAHQAVTGLHMAGMLHRDIKPDNTSVINGDLFLKDFDVLERGTEQWMTLHQ